jgi:polyhydroxybutyrate depolymerase
MRASRSVILAAAGLVCAGFVGPGCRCGKKPPPPVSLVEGDSGVLPRRPAAGDAGAMRTETVVTRASGEERRYLLVEPAKLDSGKRYPLVLVLHGDGGEPAAMHRAWPFERASGSAAVLAYLEGLGATWNLETTDDNPDVRFAAAVVDDIARTRPIDRQRVFGAGYSSGGFMVNVIACQKAGLLHAISSNAGGAPYNQREQWPNGFPKCPGQEPIAMLAFHGDRDSDVTPDSGRFSAEYWAYVNGCSTDQTETTGYPECHAYRGCPAGKAVALCTIPHIGHWVWDDAAEASWTFFQAAR